MNGKCVGRVVLVQLLLDHHFGNADLFVLALNHTHRIRIRALVLLVNVDIGARGLLCKEIVKTDEM